MVERTCTEADIDEAGDATADHRRGRGEFIRRPRAQARLHGRLCTCSTTRPSARSSARTVPACATSALEKAHRLVVSAHVPHGNGHGAAGGAGGSATRRHRPRARLRAHAMVGSVAVGDRAVLNTTAVGFGLGTGGWHVVHWNPREVRGPRPRPHHEAPLHEPAGRRRLHRGARLPSDTGLGGMPVIVGSLHSQVPGWRRPSSTPTLKRASPT